MTPLRTVLVANRGEIAVRIIRACRAAGLRTIAVYSDADEQALHTRVADQAYHIGPPPARESYLNVAALVEVARLAGADAVHPGYGFLAENADFADRCQSAGLVWIGPPPSAMRLLGDKASARALAERLGVPTLSGYHGLAQDDVALAAAAAPVGYPLLVKAAAGGGGRGMRLVREPEQLAEALAAARREAAAAFGDDRLLLERYLDRPRHVEIQLLGDLHGNLIHLGERDCSVQRRHQKVVEEAPAPRFSEDQRRAMADAALAIGRAAGYSSAGTVEFLLDQAGHFYFLEVNTRLQVEHPVTELITGLDLVGLQLRVAAGEPLPITQEQVRPVGHAVECRLYAEDPSAGFVPSTGRIDRLTLPEGEPGLRVDAGVEIGSTVSPHYDPMLAKIVAFGPTRDQALDRLAVALSLTLVEGVRTNLDLLSAVVGSDAFGQARLHTGLLQEFGLPQGPLVPPADLLAAAAAAAILPPPALQSGDPWRQVGPWRPSWVGAEVVYEYAGQPFRVAVQPSRSPAEPWRFTLPDGPLECRVRRTEGGIALGGPLGWQQVDITITGGWTVVRLGRRAVRLRPATLLRPSAASAAQADRHAHALVVAPLPGRLVRVLVVPGDRVELNQTLAVLEAMKIEHLVAAPRSGVVASIRCQPGDQVDLGAPIVELEES